MELLYLWIKKYKGITEKGFNFSSKYEFTFNYNNNVKPLLEIRPNPEYSENFFENNLILNITALIGQNGSGKTTVLDFIRNNMLTSNSIINSDCIIVLKLNIDNNDRIIILTSEKIILEVNNFTNEVVRIPKEYNVQDRNMEFDKWSVIYYSNIFDFTDSQEWEGLINISTNYLLRNDKESYTNDSSTNMLESVAHYLNETFRELEFIANYKNIKSIPIDFPEYLYISPNENDKNYLLRDGSERYKETISFLDKIDNKVQTKKDVLNVFKVSVYKACFYNFLKVFSLLPSNIKLREIFANIKKRNVKSTIRKFFYELIDNKANIDFRKHSNNILLFLDYCENFIKEKNFDYNNNCIKISVNKDEIKKFEKFIKLYYSTVKINSYLNFIWNRPMSSGEQSLLNLYSRFYSSIPKRGMGKLKDNLLILIDEGDLYYHPEWQRKFLSNLIDLITIIHPQKKMQIILTSNSPFIASDLPKNHILYLPHKYGVAHDEELKMPKDQTFFANIHMLLSDTFFMKSTVGEFASKKVTELITYINSDNRDEKIKPKMKKLLDLIGEPVVKAKLQDMWINKFGVDEEIELLENRINLLRNKT